MHYYEHVLKSAKFQTNQKQLMRGGGINKAIQKIRSLKTKLKKHNFN